MNEPMKTSSYLTEEQIAYVRQRLPQVFSIRLADKAIAEIDRLVRENGKADPQYEALQQIIVNLSLCTSMTWDIHIKDSFFPLYMTAYFNMLVLVGLIGEEEFAKIQEAIAKLSGKKAPTPEA